jgi:hypothetical protein
MSMLRPDAAQRVREALRFVPLATILFVVSRILFDLLAGRPMFWSSHEGVVDLLWKAVVFIPVVLFALMVAAQRNNPRK